MSLASAVFPSQERSPMKKDRKIRRELLDELLAGYAKPKDLTGPEGLLKQLTGALPEPSSASSAAPPSPLKPPRPLRPLRLSPLPIRPAWARYGDTLQSESRSPDG